MFPYFAFGSAVLFIIGFFLSFSFMVRIGSLSRTSPYDGSTQLLLAMILTFLPRMMHLPLGFATALNVVAVLAFELFLAVMYNIYGYSCGCYVLTSNDMNKALSTAVIWAIVLNLIYRIQLANDLAARKAFLRVLDKNRELMKAEEDKRALADNVRELEIDNERIRKEVAVSGMNKMQVKMVQVSGRRGKK